jgi:hypothetical protein
MSLAINYWLQRRDWRKAESAADAHSNMDAYFPHASLGALSQINLICASWLMAAERSQSTHNGGSRATAATSDRHAARVAFQNASDPIAESGNASPRHPHH